MHSFYKDDICIIQPIDGSNGEFILLMQSHNHDTYTTILIYIRKHNEQNNDERTQIFRKIYLPHFIRNCERVTKGLCVRGELETEQTRTY